MPIAISIMAKAPEPGRVKTRLCPPLRPEQAAQLAEGFLLDTAATACALDEAEVLLVYDGDRTRFPEPVQKLNAFLQRGANLGLRIEHAARIALSRGAPAIVMGADIPGLPVDYLRQARTALRDHDVVLGPSDDGGFYLIGMRSCPPGLLDGLAWSVPETYAVCFARLEQRGLRVAKVAPYNDIDTIDDLRAFKTRLASGAICAPATARVLEGLTCV